MNKNIKIAILSIFALLLIGLCIYCHKRVSSPSSVSFQNQYEKEDNSEIEKMKTFSSQSSRDSLFDLILFDVHFQKENGLIEDEGKWVDKATAAYAPLFIDFCNSEFKKTVWQESELTKIETRTNKLLSLGIGRKAIADNSDIAASLSEVIATVGNYYKARAASRDVRYAGIPHARQAIANARKYAEMSPINNCVSLVEALNQVPEQLGKHHFQYLQKEVGKMGNCNYATQENARAVELKLKEYRKNAKELYGKSISTDRLEGIAAEYYYKCN